MKPLTLDASHNDAGVLLDGLRVLAAQAVCIGHAHNLLLLHEQGVLPPPAWPYPQNIGVLVFFVLSGFLIAHALLRGRQRPGYGLVPFVLERTARIHSAYLPALLVVLAIEGLLFCSGERSGAARLGAGVLLGNVLMLQNYVGPLQDALSVPALGSAGQLWTLAVEWHLYLFIGGAWFAAAGSSVRQRVAGLLLAVLAAPVPLAYLGDAPPAAGLGNGLTLLWLLGFAAYFLLGAGVASGVPVPLLWALAALAALSWYDGTVPALEYRSERYPLFAFAFLLLIAAGLNQRRLGRHAGLQRFVRRAADCSFSLYLLHYSLLHALLVWWPGAGWFGRTRGAGSERDRRNLCALHGSPAPRTGRAAAPRLAVAGRRRAADALPVPAADAGAAGVYAGRDAVCRLVPPAEAAGRAGRVRRRGPARIPLGADGRRTLGRCAARRRWHAGFRARLPGGASGPVSGPAGRGPAAARRTACGDLGQCQRRTGGAAAGRCDHDGLPAPAGDDGPADRPARACARHGEPVSESDRLDGWRHRVTGGLHVHEQ